MGTYLGIDFGTSFCRTAIIKDGSFEVIPPGNSFLEMPFSTSIHRGMQHNKKVSFEGIKQKIDFDVQVSQNNEKIPIIDYASKIFNEIKNNINSNYNYKIDSTILTLPSCFTERQRASLKSAAEHGGFKNLNLLDESTALLLSTDLPKDWTNILVLTLGAGVFNLSIFSNTKGALKAIWHDGNRHLGGNNFDASIITHLVGIQVLHESVFHSGLKEIKTVKKLAQYVKHTLSEKTENDIDFRNEFTASFITGKFNLTRSEFEKIIQSDIAEILGFIDKGILECGINLSDIDKIILEGGSTQIPILKENIVARFGANVIYASDIQIAKGAALYGYKFPNKLNAGKPEVAGKNDLPKKVLENRKLQVQPVSVKKDSSWINLFSGYISEAQDLWENYKQIQSIEKLDSLRTEIKNFINNLYLQHGKYLLIENKVDEAFQILVIGIKYNPDNEAITKIFIEACNKKSNLEIGRENYEEAKRIVCQGLKYIPNSKQLRMKLKEVKNMKSRSRNAAFKKSRN